MITFKEFLIEGGKATEHLGTSRATKADMESALQFISKAIGTPVQTLSDRLLGSARLTYGGHQGDSGDVDIALNSEELDMVATVKKIRFATGHKPTVIGGTTFSFAVPVQGGRKVQVDLMFVPDVKWAKFSHHASEHSAHKSGVRNELLHAALKFSEEPGKDLRVQDEAGRDIARASRSYKLDQGVERIFKISPMRKDGKGRVKGSVKVSPTEVQDSLDQIGHTGKFSHEADSIRDPDKFAELLFGPKIKAKDMMSAEQLIKLISKRPDADEIFKSAVHGIISRNFDVPEQLKKYVQE